VIGVPRQRRLQLLLRVAFDSMPEARRRAVLALYGRDEPMSGKGLQPSSKVSAQTTRRHLEDLEAFDIVAMRPRDQEEYRYRLTDATRERMESLFKAAGADPRRRS
jgi:predicted ArsR family transcriptional regulator